MNINLKFYDGVEKNNVCKKLSRIDTFSDT